MKMRWLEKFGKGLEKHAGKSVKSKVMKRFPADSTQKNAEQMTEWLLAAIDRLDAAVPDEETRRSIMLCCSEIFPAQRIQRLRAEYERTGNLDELIKWMSEDSSWKGLSYYEYPKREGNIIYVTKIPHDPKGFREAIDPAHKRASYCHCALIRPAILSGTPVSTTFCLCGSGWYKSLWEGVLGKPVHVEILETVSTGADRCTFAVHLPAVVDR
jgi:hypothetical protein